MTVALDRAWLERHPLPTIDDGLDKHARGRVLVIGGSRRVPGATLLTGEAALRVGAGNAQIASVEAVMPGLGLAFPESAVIALPEGASGEIARLTGELEEAAARSEVVVIGPGMSRADEVPALLRRLFGAIGDETMLVIDAAAIPALGAMADAPPAGRCVLTPHLGEMARLLDRGAIVALKSAQTYITARDGPLLKFTSPAPGLGTAGSGDVLAGTIAGLLARGMAPVDATAWGVWLHAEAGRRIGARGPIIGYLARELLAELPALVSEASARPDDG